MRTSHVTDKYAMSWRSSAWEAARQWPWLESQCWRKRPPDVHFYQYCSFNKNTITDVKQKMPSYTEALNAVLYNATLDAFQKDLHKTEQTCLKENAKIVAKAWRTVKLSNQNVKEFSFHKTENRFRNTGQQHTRQNRHHQYDNTDQRYTDRTNEVRDNTRRRKSYRVFTSNRRPYRNEDTDSTDEYYYRPQEHRQ